MEILGTAGHRDPAVAEFAGRAQRLRPVGRDVDRDGLIEVDEVTVAMEKLYLARLAGVSVVDLLAVEQRAHHAQIFAELTRRHRVLPHHTHRGMAGADTQKDAAGRKLS